MRLRLPVVAALLLCGPMLPGVAWVQGGSAAAGGASPAPGQAPASDAGVPVASAAGTLRAPAAPALPASGAGVLPASAAPVPAPVAEGLPASGADGLPASGAAALPAPAPAAPATGAPVRIVAAENFYGDVARQLAGPRAAVTSILSNPDEDPHLFEASPSVARALSGAGIVIANGADYDPWMARLLSAAGGTGRRSIVVADLVHRRAGENPHLWYDPDTMPALAQALTADLVAADTGGRAEYEARLQRFLASLRPLTARVAALRARYAGVAVTATEPVFGYMAAALGLVMRNERFQLAVMNDTEPGASDVAGFEADLRLHRVRLLIYNSQATDVAARRLLGLAKASGVPVIGVTETEPAGRDYQGWMLGELDALDRALSGGAS